MTGHRASSSGSADGAADAFATVDSDRVRILAGVRQQVGEWTLQIDNLPSVGLPSEGTVTVQTYAFVDNGVYGAVDAPQDRGTFDHQISGGSVSFAIYSPQEDVDTAYAFEFSVA